MLLGEVNLANIIPIFEQELNGTYFLFQYQCLLETLEGLIKMTHAFLPYVRKAVINIASAASKETYPEMVVYCSTKFGVRGFTQALPKEYPRLRICCINPDMTATRLSGYEGRPPAEVADVIFRVAAGQIKFERGGDVDGRRGERGHLDRAVPVLRDERVVADEREAPGLLHIDDRVREARRVAAPA